MFMIFIVPRPFSSLLAFCLRTDWECWWGVIALGGEIGSRLAYTQKSEGQNLPERPFPFASWCNQERVGL